MRAFDQNVFNILESGNVSIFYLVSFIFSDYTLRLTSLPYSVTFDGEVFSDEYGIVLIAPPKLSKTLDRQSYKITLSDFEFGLANRLLVENVGVQATVKIGFINTADAPIYNYEPGSPILSPLMIYTVYKGILDDAGYSSSKDGVRLELTCAAPLANFEMVKVTHATKESIKNLSPGDTCFDQIHLGSKSFDLVWGKS